MTVLNAFLQYMSGSKRMKFISTDKLKLRKGKTKLQNVLRSTNTTPVNKHHLSVEIIHDFQGHLNALNEKAIIKN